MTPVDRNGVDARELAAQLRVKVAARLAAEPATDGRRQARVAELIEQELQAHTRAALRTGTAVPAAVIEAQVARTVRDGLLAMGGFQRRLDDRGAGSVGPGSQRPAPARRRR